jgi:simple sugar transport system substrate-binding protein
MLLLGERCTTPTSPTSQEKVKIPIPTMLVRLLLLLSISVAALARAETIKVGFITKFPADFFSTLQNAAKDYASKNADVQIIFGQGQSATDTAGQINLIESMISQGVKGIAITPVSPELVPALDKAVTAGVKIVLMDNDIPSWKGKSAVVATNNLEGGKLAGKWLATKLKAGDKIAVLEGVPGVPALDDRVKGMVEGLGGLEVKVVGKAPTNCTRELGVSGAEDLLAANPEVAAIYAACGPPALGAIQAIAHSGSKQHIILVGFDALPEEIKEIKAGNEDASVAQFPKKIGELGVSTLIKVIRGESVPSFVDTDTAIVTKENANEFE